MDTSHGPPHWLPKLRRPPGTNGEAPKDKDRSQCTTPRRGCKPRFASLDEAIAHVLKSAGDR